MGIIKEEKFRRMAATQMSGRHKYFSSSYLAQSCYRSSLHLASKHLFESRKRNIYYWLRLNIDDINAMINHRIIKYVQLFCFWRHFLYFISSFMERFDIYQINGHNLHFLPLFWFSSFPFTISLHRKTRDNKRVR